MRPFPADHAPSALEQQIVELLAHEPSLTFTSLAKTLSGHRWINLLKALSQLEQLHIIRLTPLPWDYEIRLLSLPVSDMPRLSLRRD